MIQKTYLRNFLLATVALLSSGGWAYADPALLDKEVVEVPLERIFVPHSGYGSNNNVQVTLDGFLPNLCYQLGKAKIEKGSDPYHLTIHQYATVQKDGVCADMTKLPEHLASIVPYTYDINLGRLAAGEYKLSYNTGSKELNLRDFHVYSSRNLTADDYPYAAISTISMPDIIMTTPSLSIDLSGVFTSSCSYLSNVQVTKEQDVIVVQPVLGYRKDTLCTQMLIPFKEKVFIGDFSQEGRYLVHVRAMSGQAINHAFSVIAPQSFIH